jgi:hypothetical protein
VRSVTEPSAPIRRVADAPSSGDLREVPQVAGGASGPLSAALNAIGARYADPDAIPAPEAGTVCPLTTNDVAWIGAFATFLADCGGCRQW